jgi:hypothetical protein
MLPAASAARNTLDECSALRDRQQWRDGDQLGKFRSANPTRPILAELSDLSAHTIAAELNNDPPAGGLTAMA